jgi:hypothetical protein
MSTKDNSSVKCLDKTYVSKEAASITSPFPYRAVVLRLRPGQG